MKRRILAIFITIISIIALASCGGSNDPYANYTKAVFYLEGGQCQNTFDRVSYLYLLEDGQSILIADPNSLENDESKQIIRNGYHIEGWYKTKTVNGDTVQYSDKWDFTTNKMTKDGVVLYAKWAKNVVYSYELYYKNENGSDVFLDKYTVSEGEKFDILFMNNSSVDGYTTIGYLDENQNPWDENYRHPGGDADLAIKVYLDLIKGDYAVVKNVSEFKSNIAKNNKIYLINDLDFKNSSINFDNYSNEIIGNNHKISNFEIYYNASKSALKPEIGEDNPKDHLYISLFYDLSGATIKDLTFENVKIDVKTTSTMVKYIVVSPLAIIADNTKLTNVNFSGEIIITSTPSDCELTVITDKFAYKMENIDIIDSLLNINYNN